MLRYPLLARSYFLKTAPIYFLVQLMQGFVSMAFINSMKLMPPVSQASNSATISQTVFLFGQKPFCVNSNLRSFGSNTPHPVESQESNTSFKSMTSSTVKDPVTQFPGTNYLKSFLLNRMLQFYEPRSGARSQLLFGEWPYFTGVLLFILLPEFWNDVVLALLVGTLIDILIYIYCISNKNIKIHNIKFIFLNYEKETYMGIQCILSTHLFQHVF